jgi:putative adenylate-forming enzyme
LWQIWWIRNAGAHAVAAARSSRLNELVRFARRHSPLYREAYRGVPDRVPTPEMLPVMTRRQLMSRFDEWVTDASVRRHDVEALLADRTRVGERFRDRCLVWKSSGTTGEPGIYVQDDDALAVYDALAVAKLSSAELAQASAEALGLRGGRAALIAAVGEHFASTVTWTRGFRSLPGFANRALSIMDPLPDLVAELNAFAPGFVASYPTMLSLLADEQSAGRLRVAPSFLWSAGECLSPRIRANLERAFRCPVVDEYGASECLSIAFGCAEGWLHVNADWVILEPVDSEFRPTGPGETSHTVLVTNLANRLQPVIRYDLGDSVLVKPEPCRCGNPLPAIRVDGRRDDIVTLRSDAGHSVRLVPQALATVVEEAADVHRFQIVHMGGNHLVLRFAGDDPQRSQAAFARASRALRGYLSSQGIGAAHIALDKMPPVQDLRSGKVRQVIERSAHASRTTSTGHR